MSLRDFLHLNRRTAKSMALELGVHPNYLRMVKNGKYKPGLDLCLRIEILTGGKVTTKELRGEDE